MPEEIPAVDDGTGVTKNRKRLGARTYRPRKPVPMANDAVSAEERMEPGTSMFTLTKEEREQYGIKPDSKYTWVRHPRIWEPAEGVDRAVQSISKGYRVVTHNGVPVSKGTDLVLVEIPRELWEKHDRQLEEQTRDWERRVQQQDWPDQFHVGDKEELRARLEAEKEMIRRSQMAGKGSPTAHLPPFAVEQGLLSKEEAQLMEMQARRGGRTPTPQEREIEAKLRDAIEKASSKGRRFYSIPK